MITLSFDPAELQTYREGLEELLALKSDKVITNNMPEHVPILFEVIFKYAQSHIRILCDNLDAPTFDNPRVLAQFRRALSRHVFVDILTRREPEAVQFLQTGQVLPNVRIQKADPSFVAQWDRNFAVLDESMLRIETLGKTSEALAIMHCPEEARGWAAFFDRIATLQPGTSLTDLR